MNSLLLIGSMQASLWYFVPLLVVISLVYGGTRHETLKGILQHAIQSTVLLLLFFAMIFAMIWLSGFGNTSEPLSSKSVKVILSIIGWIFAGYWITGQVFRDDKKKGFLCIATGGVFALVFGLQHLKHFWFLVAIMIISIITLGWSLLFA